MSDLRKAAQQALEFVTSERWGTTPYMDVRVYEDAARIRDTLRAALADQDRGWYTIDEINAKFDPEWAPRRDDMNRWEAEIHSWRQRYEALLKTVADHKSLAPPMMLAEKQSYELGLLDGAAAEREAIIDIVAMHGNSVEIEAAIRARGNT